MSGIISNDINLKLYMGIVGVCDILRIVWLINTDMFDENSDGSETPTGSATDEEKESTDE